MAKSLSIARISYKYLLHSQIMNSNKSIIVRSLYSKEALGLESYLQTRERIASQFANMTDKFKTKMEEFVQPKAANMIFTEDLKNMIHLVENSERDLKLINDMILRFYKQNTTLRFGNFVFGPVIMRMFYYLNKPDLALECFKNPELDGFFDQLITYQILMDLLYKNGKYDQVIEIFELVKSKQIQNAKYPKHVIVLTLAALYKQNTKESFEYALNLWKELQKVGHRPMRKASTFMAALALKQNAPEIALEILSNVTNQSYMTVRNLKVLALCEINRFDDALNILKSILNIDLPNQQKLTFNMDVIKKVEEKIKKTENKELITLFDRTLKLLKDNGHITQNNLDDDICKDIEPNHNLLNYKQQMIGRTRIIRQNFESAPRQQFNRPGLRDLQ